LLPIDIQHLNSQLVSNSLDAIVFATLDGIIHFANPAAYALYGYQEPELIGMHVDIFNAQKSHETQAIIDSIIAEGKWRGEIVQRRKNGSEIHALLHVHLVYNEFGVPVGYASNSRDITNISRLSHRLHEQELYFKTIAENSPLRIIHLALDGTILYMKTPSSRPAESVIGHNVLHFLLPAEAEKYWNYMQQCIATGLPVDFETIGNQEDGPGFVRYRAYINPIFNSNTVTGLILMYQNTEQQMRALEELEAQRFNLTSILNNTQDVIVSIDRHLNVTEFNQVLAEKALRFGVELQKGTPILSIINPQNHNHLLSIYQKVFEGERVLDTEEFVFGEVKVYYETSYNPIMDSLGGVSGISIFSKDVTESRHQEAMLRKALREKEMLLAEIHHRLKNNLAVVTSMLELQALHAEDENLSRSLRESQQRIKSTALIHEMLYEHESVTLIKALSFCKRLHTGLNNSLYGSTAVLRLEGDHDTLLDLTTAVPFGLLVNELMVNSLKHNLANSSFSQISIRLTPESDNKWLLTFSDDGIGFPEGFSFPTAFTTGMVLIKTFVEQMEGEVDVLPGPGARYQIKLVL
jgi:PAS domain S-box-containing protein